MVWLNLYWGGVFTGILAELDYRIVQKKGYKYFLLGEILREIENLKEKNFEMEKNIDMLMEIIKNDTSTQTIPKREGQ